MSVYENELHNLFMHDKQFPPQDIPPNKDEPNPDLPPDEGEDH